MESGEESGLVEALYDAALGYRLWEEVARQIADYMGGNLLMLSAHDSRSSAVDVVSTVGLTPDHIRQYGHFAPHDLWASGYLKQGLNGTRIGSHIVDDRVLVKSYIYNEYLRPQVDSRYVAGAVLPLDGGHHAVFGVHRPHGATDFSLQEAARLDRLLPHVQRSMEVRRRLQGVQQGNHSAYAVLDRLSLGVILMAATGRLLHVNAAGETILRSGDGLVRSPEGLQAANKEDDKRLQHLIDGVRLGSGDARLTGGHLSVRRPSGRQSYAVMVSPAGQGLVTVAKASPAVLVFVSDPAAKIVSDLAVLADVFGFTPAEGQLVLALLSGVALPEYARRTGVSYHTVRTLLARAMSRTDTRSQLDLVLLVARSQP
ncbi:helix-turn-helix transcriptional regulator [Reyranella sp.]|uniref:helix-turn-helix transcriptional regulator n=1 Tax=Reyranella sp. TaxID=1929291 RepID=UPI003D0D189B